MENFEELRQKTQIEVAKVLDHMMFELIVAAEARRFNEAGYAPTDAPLRSPYERDRQKAELMRIADAAVQATLDNSVIRRAHIEDRDALKLKRLPPLIPSHPATPRE